MQENAFVEQICIALIESLLMGKGVKEEHLSDEIARCFFDKRKEKNQFAELGIKLNVPIVGIGAPAKIWFEKVAEKLHCRVIVPENSEVANAVGTVSGNVRESLEALIRYDCHIRKYIAHLPNKRVVFEKLDEAIESAEKELALCGKDFAEKLGIKEYHTCIDKDEVETEGRNHSQDNFVELRMRLTISADVKNINH